VTEDLQVDAQRGWRMVLRRTAALVAGEGAARVVGFVIVLLLARRLGPTGFGVVTFGLTLVGWLAFVTDSGTEVLNVREIARRPRQFKQIAEQMLGLRLALSALATVVFVVGVMLFARSDLTRSTLLLFAFILPATALNLRWMVLGVGGSRAIALGLILSRLFVLAGVLLVVADLTDLKRVPVLEAVGALVYALTILWIVGGGWRLRPRANLAVWKDTLRRSVPLMVNGLARSAVVSFDILVIELALGPRSVGIYGVASKPALFFTACVGLFSLAFLSAFSATAPESAAALKGQALRWAVGIAVLAAACLSAASVLIPAVFGERYERAVPLLAVMAWRVPLAVLAGVYSSVLIARDRQVDLMNNSIVTACFVIVADIVAVVTVGLMGAAVVSVAAAGLAFLLNWRSVRRSFPELAGIRLGLTNRSAGP
jgi:O-antigen/teichoic acid export membrane protein